MAEEQEPEQLQMHLVVERPPESPPPVVMRKPYKPGWVWPVIGLCVIVNVLVWHLVVGDTFHAKDAEIHVDVGPLEYDGSIAQSNAQMIDEAANKACSVNPILHLVESPPARLTIWVASDEYSLGYVTFNCWDHSVIDNGLHAPAGS